MLSKMNKVREALLKVSQNVGHYKAMKMDDQYIVWAEDSEGSAQGADNRKEEYSIQGTVDYFTKLDMDKMVEMIPEALNSEGIAHYLNSVQYEEETDYTHYEWVWEVA